MRLPRGYRKLALKMLRSGVSRGNVELFVARVNLCLFARYALNTVVARRALNWALQEYYAPLVSRIFKQGFFERLAGRQASHAPPLSVWSMVKYDRNH